MPIPSTEGLWRIAIDIMTIKTYNEDDVAKLRVAGKLAADVLVMIEPSSISKRNSRRFLHVSATTDIQRQHAFQ